MTNTSCNVSFAGFTNFTASFPPAQRIIVGNSSNPLYLRYALMTQDSVQLVYYSASVTIPMDALYQVAFAAQPALTFPPVINVQPLGVVSDYHGSCIGVILFVGVFGDTCKLSMVGSAFGFFFVVLTNSVHWTL